MESSTTTEIWVERVASWRASGERAEAFSRRGGYAASTLRWWASKLKREMAAPAVTAPAAVQLARVVRTPPVAPGEARDRAIVLEVVDFEIARGELGLDERKLDEIQNEAEQLVPQILWL